MPEWWKAQAFRRVPLLAMKPLLVFLVTASLHAADFASWSTQSPREEIRPQFSSGADDALIITHDQREGLDGWFQKSFKVKGGAVLSLRCPAQDERRYECPAELPRACRVAG